jgi:hypothetical protein
MSPDDLVVRRRPIQLDNTWNHIPFSQNVAWEHLMVKVAHEDPLKSCPVCMDSFESPNDQVVTLPCSDRVHRNCARNIGNQCPAEYCQEFILPFSGKDIALPSSLHRESTRAVAVNPRITGQISRTCYAQAIAGTIVAVDLRITGRRIIQHDTLVMNIIREFGGGYNGFNVNQMLVRLKNGIPDQEPLRFEYTKYQRPTHNLRDKALEILKKGRPALVVFGTDSIFWRAFCTAASNPPYLVTGQTVQHAVGSSHAVILTGFHEAPSNPLVPYFVMKNSWILDNGDLWGDEGYCKVSMDFPFYEVYDIYVNDINLSARECRYFEFSRENPFYITEFIVNSSTDIIEGITLNGVTYGNTNFGSSKVTRWFNNFYSVFITKIIMQPRSINSQILRYIEVHFSNKDVVSSGTRQANGLRCVELSNNSGVRLQIPLPTVIHAYSGFLSILTYRNVVGILSQV